MIVLVDFLAKIADQPSTKSFLFSFIVMGLPKSCSHEVIVYERSISANYETTIILSLMFKVHSSLRWFHGNFTQMHLDILLSRGVTSFRF